MLIVQVVEILWTKATRGAPRANERSALPRQFALSGEVGAYVAEHHRLVEWEGNFALQPVKVETKQSVPGSEDELRIISQRDGTFHLGLSGTPHGGRPRRMPVADGLVLKSGSYVRLVVNARHTSYSGQWYSEKVFNVAMGERIAGNRFLSAEPEQTLDLRANLF
ncbi:hypothetical protein J2W27_004509 [Variovorax boronicumulans]|uniref:hypothetical protein n=1 Tax=Variovorax boronicumulans TaxID=436515 RepID=UPI002782E223|nr:hypothetical protein [Variovorax boronicumulans]MDP9912383.1 hypothetical protein [Variovorax boronicumulans]